MSGDDTMALKLVGEGGDGVVSVASNIIPGKMVEMVHCALQGDIQAATALETPLVDFFKAMFVETNPIPIKTAMAVAGKCQEIFRLPMCSLSTEENRKIVTDALAKI
jgi:4-hydroxy-tetrahydrodipicolinate synthase